MSANLLTGTVLGLDFEPVDVEIDIMNGLPGFVIVGLPDAAVQEAKERVKAAIKNSGFDFPRTHIIANLAPADIKKEGPLFDLPIALGILSAMGAFPREALGTDSLFFGELALDGSVRGINGALPLALGAKKRGLKNIFLPAANAKEAGLVPGLTIFPIANLGELAIHLQGGQAIQPLAPDLPNSAPEPKYDYDFAFIRGQDHAKRALEIAAAGGHNLLFSGPPGAGKTLLARSLPSILPPLTPEETLEVTQIWSVAGELPKDAPLISIRPFRSPHHTSSAVALVGGGSFPRPGEISLAHRGVLFLDEFPEFQRSVIENLRQPLEDGFVTISRMAGTVRFPARFILVAAQNPCPCGYFGEHTKPCSCSPGRILNYQKKISGPLLDRIDLQLKLPQVPISDLSGQIVAEASLEIRKRVIAARDLQNLRFKNSTLVTNSEMSPQLLKQYCPLGGDAQKLLTTAAEKLKLSARAYFRLIKISRTIADLSASQNIETPHIAEALQYRDLTS
ncbi:MAG: YifB family Mg chelatase-like AAA ATPase [bacterium]